MSTSDRRTLPENPSFEHLRKEAKQLAAAHGALLSDTQRELAKSYGFKDWAALKAHVRSREAPRRFRPLPRRRGMATFLWCGA